MTCMSPQQQLQQHRSSPNWCRPSFVRSSAAAAGRSFRASPVPLGAPQRLSVVARVTFVANLAQPLAPRFPRCRAHALCLVAAHHPRPASEGASCLTQELTGARLQLRPLWLWRCHPAWPEARRLATACAPPRVLASGGRGHRRGASKGALVRGAAARHRKGATRLSSGPLHPFC